MVYGITVAAHNTNVLHQSILECQDRLHLQQVGSQHPDRAHPAAAPGVAAALGFSEGTFRVPGTGPFAMFRPLREDAVIPEYFGLAFD